ncbi:DUF1836 domain-containing protein [Clostridium sp. MD294]|uniref:DUF1836 domain-containing protein n=1 Tax=Clostridium sp. MD294 TaxID=97138 RepID=UPI0002C8FE86|nr:DUF1836 domain-containing protein [Clostridium sp. MD294]NDO46027.1 DUF1836 domain-containing protein [Clostridium sp. MD294]USF30309.1 hypothetical protein C820_001750 [Clostridium sp. MD294]
MKEQKNITEQISKILDSYDIVPIETIPNIDLYMDQVTTFIESALSGCKRNKNDKILTKTMINNYAKAKIFPPPLKKKYTKNHIMLLIMIYHLKSILSISDISRLLKPVTEELTKNMQSPLLEMIYSDFVELQKQNQKNIAMVLENNYIENTIASPQYHQYENETIQNIIVVLQLVIQSNTEKRIAEKILDAHFSVKKTTSKS